MLEYESVTYLVFPSLIILSLTSQEYDIQVHKNDVVILGSDGIWDNLFEKQIVEIVTSVQKAGGGPEVRYIYSITLA